jgi:hypothetical protein
MMVVASAAKLVEAGSNAMAAVKCTPLRNGERASATAEYEQQDEAAPSARAVTIERGR